VPDARLKIIAGCLPAVLGGQSEACPPSYVFQFTNGGHGAIDAPLPTLRLSLQAIFDFLPAVNSAPA
jgi:hypothetical protein